MREMIFYMPIYIIRSSIPLINFLNNTLFLVLHQEWSRDLNARILSRIRSRLLSFTSFKIFLSLKII
jgi:hypothetical protein